MSKTRTSPLQIYWEEKLHIKYEEEFEYYKKLCGISNKKKLFRKRNNICSKLNTYKEWQHHILKTIDKLDIEELKEYSRYLNQKYREKEVYFGLFQSICIPLIISYVTVCLTFGLNIIDAQIDNGTAIFIVVLISIFYFWIFFKIYFDSEKPTYKHFYFDMKEIVDETISAIENH